MPRFYFHIRDAPDQEGTELPDIERARQEAICIAGELLRDGIGKVIWDEKPWRWSPISPAVE